MADKEKSPNSQIVSALTLLPVAYGMVKYAPEVLDQLKQESRNLGGHLFSKADDLIDFEFLEKSLKSALNTESGAAAKRVLIDKDSSKLLAETIHNNTLTKKTLNQSKHSKLIESIVSMETKVSDVKKLRDKAQVVKNEPPHTTGASRNLHLRYKNLNKYAAFLAYKDTLGIPIEHSKSKGLSLNALDVYWNMVQQAMKHNDPDSLRIKNSYNQFLNKVYQDPDTWRLRLTRALNEQPPSSAPAKAVVNLPVEHLPTEPKEMEKYILDFIQEDRNSKWDDLLNKTGVGAERLDTMHAHEITAAITELKKELETQQKASDKYYASAMNHLDDASNARELNRAVNIRSAEIKVYSTASNFGGNKQKSIVVEIANPSAGMKSQYIHFNISNGPYTKHNMSVSPSTDTLHMPMSGKGPEDTITGPIREAQRVKAMAQKVMRDLAGNDGDPSRSSSLIDRTMRTARKTSSAASSTARDFIRGLSVDFKDLNIALGQESRSTYERIRHAVPSMEKLTQAGSGNENILVFDTEFTHKKMALGQAGPQQVIREVDTAIYQISGRVMNTKDGKWTEKSKINILIDPGEKNIDYIRMFQKGQGQEHFELEGFLKELQGPEGQIGSTSYRKKNLSDAIRTLLDFTKEQGITKVMGQNVIGMDIPLLDFQVNRTEDQKLIKRFRHLFDVDESTGLKDKVIDNFFIAHLLHGDDPSQSLNISKLNERYTGVNDDGLKRILDLSSKQQRTIPISELQRIAKDVNAPLSKVRSLYDTLFKMKLTSAEGMAHNADFDTVLNTVMSYMQKDEILNSDTSMFKYRHIHKTALDILQKGGLPWKTPFEAMDLYRPGVFTHLDESDAAAVSLFASSQQQAAKLVGSYLNMQHLVPFGLLNNMLRQRYQAFAGKLYAPPSESIIQEAEAAGFKYAPGHVISTKAGLDVHGAFLEHMSKSPRDLSKLTNSQTLPVFYTSESHIGTYGDQSYINKAATKIMSYFRSTDKIHTVELDIPERLRNLSIDEIRAKMADTHPAIQKALDRHIKAETQQGLEHGSVMTALDKTRQSEIFHTYSEKGLEEKMLDGKVKDYIIRPGDDLHGAYGMQHAEVVQKYQGADVAVVVDAQINPEQHKLIVTTAHIRRANPGTKTVMNDIKSAKTFIYGLTGDSREAVSFFGGKEAMTVPGVFGGKRQETGSFFQVQIGRIIQDLNEDPRYNKDAQAMESRAKVLFTDMLGKEATFRAVKIGVTNPTYRLQVDLPSYSTKQLYSMLTGSNLIAALEKSGRTWKAVEKAFNQQVDDLPKLAQKNQAQSAYKHLIGKSIHDLEIKVAKLRYELNNGDTKNNKALVYYNKLLEGAKRYYNEGQLNGKNDGAAMFDVGVHKYGQSISAIAGYFSSSSVSVVADVMDYVDKDISQFIETQTKMPHGHTRFRSYLTTILEENILRESSSPESMINLIKSSLGSAYVNSLGELPIMESTATIQQVLNFLKHGPDLESGIVSIEEMFDSVDWLKSYVDSDNSSTLQSLRSKQSYKILEPEEVIKINETMSDDAIAERTLRETGDLDFDRIQAQLVEQGMSEDDAARLLHKNHIFMYADSLKDMPIFDAANKETHVNLLKMTDVANALKEKGYTGSVEGLNLNLSFGDDLIGDTLKNAKMSPHLKEMLKRRAKSLKMDGGHINFVPIAQMNYAMAPHNFKEQGKNMVIKGQGIRSVLELTDSYTTRETLINNLMDDLNKGSVLIKDAAFQERLAEIADSTAAVKENVSNYMKNLIGPQLKHTFEKGTLLFSKAKYGVHSSSTNTILPVLQSILGDADYRKEHNISDDLFRSVVKRAAGDNKAVLNAISEASPESLLKIADRLAHKNEKTVTFLGFGLNESFIDESEMKKRTRSWMEELTASAEAGAISEDDLTKYKEYFKKVNAGEDYLPDIVFKDPAFPHGTTHMNKVYPMEGGVLEIAGIPKEEREAHIFSNPIRSWSMTPHLDFDGDLKANLDLGLFKFMEETREVLDNQQKILAKRMKNSSFDEEAFYPIHATEHVKEGDRLLYKMIKGNGIGIDMDRDWSLIFENMEGDYSSKVRQSLVIKSFTGVLGASHMRLLDRVSGESQIMTLLTKLMDYDKDLALHIEKETGISTKQFKHTWDLLNRQIDPKSVDIDNSMLGRYMKWDGFLSENVPIIKTGMDVGSDSTVTALSSLAEFQKHKDLGQLNKADLDYMINNPLLKDNKSWLPDYMPGETQEIRIRQAKQTMLLVNDMIKGSIAHDNYVYGQNNPTYNLITKSSGVQGVEHLIRQWAEAYPEIGNSVGMYDNQIKKMHGLGGAAFDLRLEDMIKKPKAKASLLFTESSFKNILGNFFDIGKTSREMGEYITKSIGEHGKQSMKMAAAAAAALLFFNPNMGIKTVGRGGEEFDYPQHMGRKLKSVIMQPHARTLERMLDAVDGNLENRPVLLNIPKPPQRYGKKSDLRKRNWTIDEYIRRSKGVLLT